MSERFRDALRITALVHAAALLVALTVAVIPGGPAEVRQLLALDLHPAPGSLAGAVGIFTHNLLVLCPLLIGPAIVACLGHGCWLLLAYGAWQAGWAVLTVGAAVGAYGLELVPRLVHVPLEWAALAVGMALMRAAHRGLPWSAFAACVVLLLGGALLETSVG